MKLTSESIREHLATEAGAEVSKIETTTLLFSSGMVDSFAMVNLIVFVEKSSGIKIKATDVNLDNLDSIDRILRFVASRTGAGQDPASRGNLP